MLRWLERVVNRFLPKWRYTYVQQPERTRCFWRTAWQYPAIATRHGPCSAGSPLRVPFARPPLTPGYPNRITDYTKSWTHTLALCAAFFFPTLPVAFPAKICINTLPGTSPRSCSQGSALSPCRASVFISPPVSGFSTYRPAGPYYKGAP